MVFQNLIFDLNCVNLAPIQDFDPLIAAQLRAIIIPMVCRYQAINGLSIWIDPYIFSYGRQMRLLFWLFIICIYELSQFYRCRILPYFIFLKSG